MRGSNFFKNVKYGILAGVLLGLGLALSRVKMSIKAWVGIWGILVVVIFAYILYTRIKPTILLSKGEYDKAILQFSKIMKKYKGKKKVKNAMLYNIALCYSRMGDFFNSYQCLEQMELEQIDDNLKWCYFTLSGINAILSEQEMEAGEENLKAAEKLFKGEAVYPVYAYMKALKGKEEEAMQYIEKYLNCGKGKKIAYGFSKSSLFFDHFAHNIENNYFIGMAYMKLDNSPVARVFLKKASECKYSNYFSKRAKEILNPEEEIG